MHLLAIAPQDQPIGAFKIIERNWRNDIISVIQNKLPKFLVVLLIVFVLHRLLLFFAERTLDLLPNTQSATTSNPSRDYAVATLNVSVVASANPDKVIALLADVAEQVRNHSDFRDIAVADPVILGVDKIEGRSVTYPVQIRIHTTTRDDVLRELRRCIILAFEKNGIPLGNDPANMLILRHPNPTAPPAQQPLIGS